MISVKPSQVSIFLTALFIGCSPSVALAFSTFTLEQAIHVVSTAGETLLLEPGDYSVEPADLSLRIRAVEGTAVRIIQAQPMEHEHELAEPLALSVPAEEIDQHRIMLLLPDGTGLEAIGTYSGIQTRAGFGAGLPSHLTVPSKSVCPPPVHPSVAYLSQKKWVRAHVKVVSAEDPDKFVPGVKATFAFNAYRKNAHKAQRVIPTHVYELATNQDGEARVDIEFCGEAGLVSIIVRKKIGVFPQSGGSLLKSHPEILLAHRRAPLENSQPTQTHGMRYGGSDSDPGYLSTYHRLDNAGTFDGRTYSSRQFLYVKVSEPPDQVLYSSDAPARCFDLPLWTGDLTKPTGTEPIANRIKANPDIRPFASKAVLWKAKVTQHDSGYLPNAIVVFEGIDGNNESPAVEWYDTLKRLRPNLDRWHPDSGDWGTDVWVVDYSWGGAKIDACLIPQAKDLLKGISEYYRTHVQSASQGQPVPLTVVGISMGGIVSRGTLAQLDETPGQLAQLGVRAWVTLDSPHQGAEIHYKVTTFLKQIHEATAPKIAKQRSPQSEYGYLRAWNDAARQLLFEMCPSTVKITNVTRFLRDATNCHHRSYAWHDVFYEWLGNQGPSGSQGYPMSIPTFAMSAGVGKPPNATRPSDYWNGKDSLFVVDYDRWEEVVTGGDHIGWTRLASPRWVCRDKDPVTGDCYNSVEVFDVTEDDASWTGRRNRRPGGKIGFRTSLNSAEGSFWAGGWFVPGIRVNYDPTFIPLISALDGAKESRTLPNSDRYSYKSSPFTRVWYPIENTTCFKPGMVVPCAQGMESWFHSGSDFVANRDSKGVNDLVGQGLDTAAGDSPSEQGWVIETLAQFLSGVINPHLTMRDYEGMVAPAAPQNGSRAFLPSILLPLH